LIGGTASFSDTRDIHPSPFGWIFPIDKCYRIIVDLLNLRQFLWGLVIWGLQKVHF